MNLQFSKTLTIGKNHIMPVIFSISDVVFDWEVIFNSNTKAIYKEQLELIQGKIDDGL